ncbi:MAG: polysaccharide biosynthesis tyrosine autokinase [Muribaculaceae bacterium]|nr:polysaccharide biosynthesis tyrosine autokinase [Muribaculaceae bacterium]
MERIPSDIQQPEGRKKSRNASQALQKLKLRDILYLLLSNWKWFALSLAVCVGYAYIQVKRATPVYTRSASLLIKGSDNFKGEAEGIIQELGAVGTSNLTNELMAFRTVATAEEVVRRLRLDVNYAHDGTFHKDVVYGISLPAKVRFDSIDNSASAFLVMDVQPDSTVTLSGMQFNGTPVSGTIRARLGSTVRTPLGKLFIEATPSYIPGSTSDRLEVSRSPLAAATASVRGRISANARPGASIIDIRFTDQSTARAEDVLNTLISVYNENWVKDRNQRTISTNEFIKERLGIIEQELGNVEQNISDYKSEHLMPSVEAVGSAAFGQANAAEQQRTALDNELYMVRYVRDFLTQGMHENELLPSNTGISNGTIEAQIQRYNDVMMRRNSHLANSSLQNPLVKDLDNDLAVVRSTILQSLDNELHKLNQLKRSVQSTYGQAVAKVAANPASAKYLLSVERQQKVKESLYLFLLQKREENELSQAFTAYNNQLIEPPHGSNAPVYPQPGHTLFVAFLIGLGIPAAVIFGIEFSNTAVRGRKDLENMTVPFLGEIPQHGKAPKSANAILKKRHKQRIKGEKLTPVVQVGSRDVINEAFRVMRTNLELVLGFNNTHHVIMLTSMNPGSGKTFISANLSTAIAALGKRVLAIDLDMRKGSLSRYAGNPREGISSYLSGRTDDYKSLLHKMGDVDILPCGKLPPNPSELLMSDRFKQLMELVRKEYDYVFLDCPPVEVVADASIINRYADRTLFVVRAGLLDRDALPDIEKWYDEGRFNGLSIVLNGTGDGFSHYGHHRYGSRYGYHYGNYGYGYGNDAEADTRASN